MSGISSFDIFCSCAALRFPSQFSCSIHVTNQGTSNCSSSALLSITECKKLPHGRNSICWQCKLASYVWTPSTKHRLSTCFTKHLNLSLANMQVTDKELQLLAMKDMHAFVCAHPCSSVSYSFGEFQLRKLRSD